MAYVVCAKWCGWEGVAEAVGEAGRRLAGRSKVERGVVLYQAHRDPENPNVFFFYEQYADEAAYQAHVESDHFKELGFGEAIPRLEARERAFYVTWDI